MSVSHGTTYTVPHSGRLGVERLGRDLSHRRRRRSPTRSRTTYDGSRSTRWWIRATYSPRMPSVKSCAPEKIAMIDARNRKSDRG